MLAVFLTAIFLALTYGRATYEAPNRYFSLKGVYRKWMISLSSDISSASSVHLGYTSSQVGCASTYADFASSRADFASSCAGDISASASNFASDVPLLPGEETDPEARSLSSSSSSSASSSANGKRLAVNASPEVDTDEGLTEFTERRNGSFKKKCGFLHGVQRVSNNIWGVFGHGNFLTIFGVFHGNFWKIFFEVVENGAKLILLDRTGIWDVENHTFSHCLCTLSE